MREILFRGQDVDRKEWVYGGYSLYPHTRFPCTPTIYEVDSGCWHPVEVIPETVGQYTGREDKNGQKIFEGDIVKAQVIENKWDGSKMYTDVYEVAYHPKYCYFYLKKNRNNLLFDGNWSYGVFVDEVIGNIHDNPDLLKVNKEGE